MSIQFGKNLNSIRKSNKLTQEELAVKISVSNRTISHWEHGYSEPSLEQLHQLKVVLEIDYDDLLD